MAKKYTDDALDAQFAKNTNEHGNLWKTVDQLGEEMGVAFDKEGNVNFRAVKPTDVAPQASYDIQELEGMVKQMVKDEMPKTTGSSFDDKAARKFFVEGNKHVLSIVSETWNPLIQNIVDRIVEASGIAMDASGVTLPTATPKAHSFFKMPKWLVPFYNDAMSCIWKGLAYGIAIGCAMIAISLYFDNRKLMSISKEYTIVRLVLGSDPENREMLNRIDDAIDAKGVDEVRKGLNVDKQYRHSSE